MITILHNSLPNEYRDAANNISTEISNMVEVSAPISVQIASPIGLDYDLGSQLARDAMTHLSTTDLAVTVTGITHSQDHILELDDVRLVSTQLIVQTCVGRLQLLVMAPISN